MIDVQKGFVFRLIPTKEQEEYFWKAANAARYIYNWTLEQKKSIYENQGISVSGYTLCKMLTQLKKTESYKWLNEIHNKVLKKAVLDCDEAFNRMFKGQNKYPKFKSKRTYTPSFFIESDVVCSINKILDDGTVQEKYINKIKFFRDNKVQLSGIGVVKLSNKSIKYHLWYLTEHNIPVQNCRVKFDGEHWNLSFSLNMPDQKVQTTDEIIGIDLGVKNTAICSNGEIYKDINKSRTVKKLEKMKVRYQRQLSRKYENNKIHTEDNKYKYIKTNNIIKLEKKIRRIDKRLRNIRKTYNHKISREIVNNVPYAIVMEDLNIKGMMKNKHLSRAIQNQSLYELKTFIKYKAENQGTKFIEASRNYKSTQICSHCGAEQKMSLSARVYKCKECGFEIDRDMNAAYNLRNYGKNLLLA